MCCPFADKIADDWHETPNLAARLQVVAKFARRIRCDLTAGPRPVESVDLGPCDVKGFAKPVHAWRIAGEAADVESRFQALYRAAGTPLAGRTEELGLLMQRWQQANKGEGPDRDC